MRCGRAARGDAIGVVAAFCAAAGRRKMRTPRRRREQAARDRAAQRFAKAQAQRGATVSELLALVRRATTTLMRRRRGLHRGLHDVPGRGATFCALRPARITEAPWRARVAGRPGASSTQRRAGCDRVDHRHEERVSVAARVDAGGPGLVLILIQDAGAARDRRRRGAGVRLATGTPVSTRPSARSSGCACSGCRRTLPANHVRRTTDAAAPWARGPDLARCPASAA